MHDDIDLDAEDERTPRWKTARDWILSLLAGLMIYQGVTWWRAPDLPDQAPDFTLATIEGESVALSDFRGQTVVLNFWATWCGPCRVEIPTFSDFADENPDVPVLGIATDGTPETLAAARDELGIRYPVLMADPQVVRDYQVTTIPSTVVVGPDGEVRATHVGVMFGPQLAWATR